MMSAANTSPERNPRSQASVRQPSPANSANEGERLPITAPSVMVNESGRVDLEIWTPRQRTRPLVCYPGLDPSDLEGLVAIYLALGYSLAELVIRPTGETVQHLLPRSRSLSSAPGILESTR